MTAAPPQPISQVIAAMRASAQAHRARGRMSRAKELEAFALQLESAQQQTT